MGLNHWVWYFMCITSFNPQNNPQLKRLRLGKFKSLDQVTHEANKGAKTGIWAHSISFIYSFKIHSLVLVCTHSTNESSPKRYGAVAERRLQILCRCGRQRWSPLPLPGNRGCPGACSAQRDGGGAWLSRSQDWGRGDPRLLLSCSRHILETVLPRVRREAQDTEEPRCSGHSPDDQHPCRRVWRPRRPSRGGLGQCHTARKRHPAQHSQCPERWGTANAGRCSKPRRFGRLVVQQ